MAMNDVPLDDKAKRTRNLLSSFYVTDSSSTSNAFSSSPRRTTLESINTQVFDADEYMKLLVQKSNLEGLLRKHVEMAAEIKNLDTDLQMLVYENYNKFISATETIKRMKNNIVGMETNMEQLLEKIMSVQSKSDGINTSLFEKRERIEKLHRTRNFLHKVQFIYDLPTRLGKCIKTEAYADAVRFYTGAMPIFKVYGDSSFRDCKRACEEAIDTIIKNLQGKLYSDSEPVEARAEAVVLLRHLDFPVDGLKMKLLEKLEAFLSEFQSKSGFGDVSVYSNEDLNIGNGQPSTIPDTTDVQASIVEISEAIRAYRIIFPDLEKRLIELVQDLFNTRFGKIEKHINERISSKDLLVMLQNIWKDVKVMDEALAEAALPIYSLEGARAIVKQYISTAFSNLLLEVSGILKQVQSSPKEEFEGGETLQIVFEASKKTIIHGSMNLLLDFRHLLDDSLELLVNLRDLIIDWVQEGFQEFFRTLDSHFLSLSGKNIAPAPAPAPDRVDELKMEKVHPGLALVLSQVSIFIEQNAIPQITEEIAASFSGGGVRKYEYGPAFIPGEICRIFRSSSEKLLHLYISTRTQKISLILKKRFTTPNWIKHKEPREVHMFVDLLLQELELIENEVKHVLPHGLLRKHRRSESTGSTASSRSNPTREDKNNRSNSQRAKSQLLENHLARLFKQKVEIITKVEPTQESIVSSIVKLCLRSLQEFVRLQTFNRSGFQQIQLDTQFLKNTLKDIVLDEAAVEFLIDEVVVSAAERCLDVIPLDNAILDKLVQAKLIKKKETNPTY